MKTIMTTMMTIITTVTSMIKFTITFTKATMVYIVMAIQIPLMTTRILRVFMLMWNWMAWAMHMILTTQTSLMQTSESDESWIAAYTVTMSQIIFRNSNVRDTDGNHARLKPTTGHSNKRLQNSRGLPVAEVNST